MEKEAKNQRSVYKKKRKKGISIDKKNIKNQNIEQTNVKIFEFVLRYIFPYPDFCRNCMLSKSKEKIERRELN